MKVVKKTLTCLSSYKIYGSKTTTDLNRSPKKLYSSEVCLDHSENVRIDFDTENDLLKS